MNIPQVINLDYNSMHHKIFWDEKDSTRELMKIINHFIWFISVYSDDEELNETTRQLSELVNLWRRHNP